MSTPLPFRRAVAVLIAGLALAAVPAAARAQTSPEPSPSLAPSLAPSQGPVREGEDQVVLSGSIVVPRGEVAGEIVVFSGHANIGGVVLGDVVVLNGPITVSGQVSGSVVALNGPVRILATANIRGDVLGAELVRVERGAQVGGTVREAVGFTLQGPAGVLGSLLVSIAIAGSVLLLGLALLLIAPRGIDRVITAARTAPFASAGWGLALTVALPLVAVAAMVTVVALPAGIAMLLALAMLFLVGYTCAVWTVGRAIVRPPRPRVLAFLAGWAVTTLLGLVPFLNVAVWTLGSIFGLGALAVATWRARGTHGRHRTGYVPLVAEPTERGTGVSADARGPVLTVPETVDYPATSDD